MKLIKVAAAIVPTVAAIAMTLTASPSRADDLICAAVYACVLDQDGKPTGAVLPEFAKGECAQHYRSQCVTEVANSLGEELQSCSAGSAELKSSNEALKVKIRKQERLIRKLRAHR